MQQRPSSRLLVVNGTGQVLLFRFEHRRGAVAGQVFWATPGGGVGREESYAAAARREAREELGLEIVPGPEVAQRIATFTLPTGRKVRADERYFLIRVAGHIVSDAGWTALEREVMTAHRWWSEAEVRCSQEQIWPDDLPAILGRTGVWPA